MKKSILLLWSILFFIGFEAKADSPLTSTNFSSAYANNKFVAHAKNNKLDGKILNFLGKDKTDAVIKIAIINEISWEDKTQLAVFENYLLTKRKGLKPDVFEEFRNQGTDEFPENDQTKLLSADDLMCWAYLQALNDYFIPSKAFSAAQMAYKREKNSMAHATVFALIYAQVAFDYDWCSVYRIGKEYFLDNAYSKNQLSKAAINNIMEYLNLYADSCP